MNSNTTHIRFGKESRPVFAPRSRLGEDDNSVAGDAPAVPEAEAVDWADLDHTGVCARNT